MGNASGHHTLSARDRDTEWRRILSPINLSSSGFYLLCCFSLHLFTQIVFPLTLLLFKLCISQYECMPLLWKLKRGDNEASKLQMSFGLQAVRVTAVSFYLLYNNHCVYTRNSSMKCEFSTPCSIFQVFLRLCHHFSQHLKLYVASRQDR